MFRPTGACLRRRLYYVGMKRGTVCSQLSPQTLAVMPFCDIPPYMKGCIVKSSNNQRVKDDKMFQQITQLHLQRVMDDKKIQQTRQPHPQWDERFCGQIHHEFINQYRAGQSRSMTVLMKDGVGKLECDRHIQLLEEMGAIVNGRVQVGDICVYFADVTEKAKDWLSQCEQVDVFTKTTMGSIISCKVPIIDAGKEAVVDTIEDENTKQPAKQLTKSERSDFGSADVNILKDEAHSSTILNVTSHQIHNVTTPATPPASSLAYCLKPFRVTDSWGIARPQTDKGPVRGDMLWVVDEPLARKSSTWIFVLNTGGPDVNQVPELQGRLYLRDGVIAAGDVQDRNGHGTGMLSLIAGSVHGITFTDRLCSIKFCDDKVRIKQESYSWRMLKLLQ